MSTIGDTVAALRQKRGLSQTELAHRVGVRQSFIAMLETGARESMRWDVLQKIAQALRVSVAVLCGESSDSARPPLTAEELAHFRKRQELPDTAVAELEEFTAYLYAKHVPPKPRG